MIRHEFSDGQVVWLRDMTGRDLLWLEDHDEGSRRNLMLLARLVCKEDGRPWFDDEEAIFDWPVWKLNQLSELSVPEQGHESRANLSIARS